MLEVPVVAEPAVFVQERDNGRDRVPPDAPPPQGRRVRAAGLRQAYGERGGDRGLSRRLGTAVGAPEVDVRRWAVHAAAGPRPGAHAAVPTQNCLKAFMKSGRKHDGTG